MKDTLFPAENTMPNSVRKWGSTVPVVRSSVSMPGTLWLASNAWRVAYT